MLSLLYCLLVHTGDAMITVGPVNTSAMIGGGETLTCTATGIPLPNITWMNQDGNTAGTPSDMMINPTTILSTLTFSNLQDNDFGNYVCMASNTFNNDTATALLGSEYNTVSTCCIRVTRTPWCSTPGTHNTFMIT